MSLHSAGIRPAPNSWQSWNLEMLEPPNIKAREEMLNQAKDKKSRYSYQSFIMSVIVLCCKVIRIRIYVNMCEL